MYRVIWRYEVKAEGIREFLKLYDSNGEWVQLFSQSPDFIKTELFCETQASQFFLTIDYWKSKKAYTEFYRRHKAEADHIEMLGEKLTLMEERMGELISRS